MSCVTIRLIISITLTQPPVLMRRYYYYNLLQCLVKLYVKYTLYRFWTIKGHFKDIKATMGRNWMHCLATGQNGLYQNLYEMFGRRKRDWN